MNQFASTENSGGLLQNYYDESKSPIGAALKKRRQKLYDDKIESQMNDETGLKPEREEK